MPEKIDRWNIYTDGSGNWVNRLGGLGVYMINRSTGEEIMFKEGYSNTTVPRMETMAIIYALEFLPTDVPLKARIVCDSKFVVEFINKSIFGCLNWGKNLKTDIKNRDLWSLMLEKFREHPKAKISVVWLKGGSHQKDYASDDAAGNNIADQLANYTQFSSKERIKDLQE